MEAELEPARDGSRAQAKVLLTSYLNKRLRVEISDGRIIEGNFMCTDRERNIVLSNCDEYYGWEEVRKCHMMSRFVTVSHVISYSFCSRGGGRVRGVSLPPENTRHGHSSW